MNGSASGPDPGDNGSRDYRSERFGISRQLRLFLNQVHYQLTTFFRSPVGLFFTIVLPLVMLVLLNVLFGSDTVTTPAGEWSTSQFYSVGLAGFTAVSATYTNLVNVLPIRRDGLTLKRWRSTPLPTGIYMSGWIASTVVVGALGMAVQLGAGALFYGVELSGSRLVALLITAVIGMVSFAALGLAVACLVPNAESAPAIANATILPLALISDTFVPIEKSVGWIEIANLFPLKPFINSLQNTANPLVEGSGFSPGKLLVVGIWGVIGVVFAVMRFRWEPSGTASVTPRRASDRQSTTKSE